MTNLEKFEEVFGIKLDPIEVEYTDFPCACVHVDICDKYQDGPEYDCPLHNFWNREYAEVERTKLNHGANGVS